MRSLLALTLAALLGATLAAAVPAAAQSSPPVITGFSPSYGWSGSEIQIYGEGFSTMNALQIGDYSQGWMLWSDNEISSAIPAHLAPGHYSIAVYTSEGSTVVCCYHVTHTNQDGDAWSAPDDCNDLDASVHPGAHDTPGDGLDQDCDGADAIGMAIHSLQPPRGRAGTEVHAYGAGFDTTWSVYFGGNNVDWWWYDASHLAFFVPGWAALGNHSIQITGGAGSASYCCFEVVPDNDGDGWGTDRDCNDHDAAIHPGAYDRAGDGIDQDCDGADATLPNFVATINAYYSYTARSDSAQFGAARGATDGFDPGLDSPEPPTPVQGGHVQLYFEYPEHDEATQRLSSSIVNADDGANFPLRFTWTAGNGWGYNVQLSWSDWELAQLPSEWSVYLVYDGRVVDMRSTYYETFSINTERGTKDFQIVVSTAAREDVYINPGWNLVSLPAVPFDNTLRGVFGNYADSAYTWADGGYQSVTHLHPGIGYWVHNPRSGMVVQIVGAPVEAVNLSLQPGWNLVGTTRTGGSLGDAPSHVSRTAWYWTGSGYYPTQQLYSDLGFWVYSHNAPASVSLRSSLAVNLDLPLPEETAPAMLDLPLALAAPGGAVDGARLTTRDGAASGYDTRDVVEAPRPAADVWAQAYFVAEDLELDTSVMAPTAGGVYRLRVATSGAGGATTLSWPDATLPDGFAVELVDGAKRIDMRAQSSYTFTASADVAVRALDVVVRPLQGKVCLAELDGACLAALPFDPFARR